MPLRPCLFLAALALAGGAAAREPNASPAALQKVFDCRALTDAQARLACYDASVGQLSEAKSRGDVAVVDREQVRETKRKLFGFSLGDINLFGGSGDKADRKAAHADEVEEITAKIAGVGHTSDGGWRIELDSGARWDQTDAAILGRTPKPGATAVIKRGALGSFKMSIDGGASMKVRRTG